MLSRVPPQAGLGRAATRLTRADGEDNASAVASNASTATARSACAFGAFTFAPRTRRWSGDRRLFRRHRLAVLVSAAHRCA